MNNPTSGALPEGDAVIARIPYACWLGVRLHYEDGEPRFLLPFAPGLVGNSLLPALHGGVVAAFMENAAILHVMLHHAQRSVPRSIDFSIDYLRPAQTQDCHASCAAERIGRRVAQVQVRAWQSGENRPIALARVHFLLSAPLPDDP